MHSNLNKEKLQVHKQKKNVLSQNKKIYIITQTLWKIVYKLLFNLFDEDFFTSDVWSWMWCFCTFINYRVDEYKSDTWQTSSVVMRSTLSVYRLIHSNDSMSMHDYRLCSLYFLHDYFYQSISATQVRVDFIMLDFIERWIFNEAI